METYSIILNTGEVVRGSDLKVVAPCQSIEDLDYMAYIAWIEQGNQPTLI